MLMLMVLSVFMFSLVSAEISCTNPGLPNPQEVDIETNLIQTCDTCTYVNISSITTPTTTTYLDDSMDKNGLTYNYSYAPSEIGHYYYSVYGDKDGSITEETLCFESTYTGELPNTTQGIVLIAQLGIVALSAMVPEEQINMFRGKVECINALIGGDLFDPYLVDPEEGE